MHAILVFFLFQISPSFAQNIRPMVSDFMATAESAQNEDLKDLVSNLTVDFKPVPNYPAVGDPTVYWIERLNNSTIHLTIEEDYWKVYSFNSPYKASEVRRFLQIVNEWKKANTMIKENDYRRERRVSEGQSDCSPG